MFRSVIVYLKEKNDEADLVKRTQPTGLNRCQDNNS